MWMKLSLSLVALVAALALVYAGFRHFGHNGPVTHSFRLSNGVAVEVVTGDCGPNAALVVLVGVGANEDPPGQSGMTRLMERLLRESRGTDGDIEVQSGSDDILYTIVASPEVITHELSGLSLHFMRPNLQEEDLQLAKRDVLADIAKRGGGDASLAALTDAAESILPSRGQGRRGGLAHEVATIDVAAVKAFWAGIPPASTRIVMVGDFDLEAVRANLERSLFARQASLHPPTLRAPGEMTVRGAIVMGDAPTAVAVAVRAPPLTDRAYAPFLVLAGRLLGAASEGAWSASYDPLSDPELLFVIGPVQPGEGPEVAAARIRTDYSALLARPLSQGDIVVARRKFALFLGLEEEDAVACRDNPRGVAVAIARRAQLGVDPARLVQAVEGTTQQGLAEAAGSFAPERTAAVIAGGVIR